MFPQPIAFASRARRLRQLSLEQFFEMLARRLPFPQDTPRPFRRRVFTLWRTFWLFLFQILSPGQSCRETVQAARAWLDDPARPEALCSNSSAYCQARARLPQVLLEQALRRGGQELFAQVRPQNLWCGRRVRVVDGSSVRLPDTPANQKAYPQPKTQRPGCGFPVMRLVVVFCLSCGALAAHVTGPLGVAERELWRHLWDELAAGDVALGDRGFCSLAEFWMLWQRGVDCVARLHQRRSVGVRRVRRLAKGDELVEWIKMRRPPNWLTAEQWAEVPDALRVRQVTFRVEARGFRTRRVTVATTLLDVGEFPAAALAELYRRRWQAELFIRDIKTTLGMEMLSCKSPALARKELLMHLIAYNLIRALMWEAALQHGPTPQRLSFKGALDTLRQWTPLLALCTKHGRKPMMENFLAALSTHVVPHRPGRSEPRAVKERPKNYQRLTQPRRHFREIPHRNKYRKLALS